MRSKGGRQHVHHKLNGRFVHCLVRGDMRRGEPVRGERGDRPRRRTGVAASSSSGSGEARLLMSERGERGDLAGDGGAAAAAAVAAAAGDERRSEAIMTSE